MVCGLDHSGSQPFIYTSAPLLLCGEVGVCRRSRSKTIAGHHRTGVYRRCLERTLPLLMVLTGRGTGGGRRERGSRRGCSW